MKQEEVLMAKHILAVSSNEIVKLMRAETVPLQIKAQDFCLNLWIKIGINTA